MDITQILIGVIILSVAIITIFLVPYLKKKYGTEKIAEAINTAKLLKEIAEVAVQAMEQMHPESKIGAIKLEDALKYARIEAEKYGMMFDENELRIAIESAVYKINNSINDSTVSTTFATINS